MAFGSTLGLLGSLAALFLNPDVFRLVVSSPSPKILLLAFAAGSACTVGIGAAMTGFIFQSIDDH